VSLRVDMQRELDDLLEGRRERWSARLVVRVGSVLERRKPSSGVVHLLGVAGAHGIRAAILTELSSACRLFEQGDMSGCAIATAKATELACVLAHVSRLARAAGRGRGATPCSVAE
jgi:hypothetical protein